MTYVANLHFLFIFSVAMIYQIILLSNKDSTDKIHFSVFLSCYYVMLLFIQKIFKLFPHKYTLLFPCILSMLVIEKCYYFAICASFVIIAIVHARIVQGNCTAPTSFKTRDVTSFTRFAHYLFLIFGLMASVEQLYQHSRSIEISVRTAVDRWRSELMVRNISESPKLEFWSIKQPREVLSNAKNENCLEIVCINLE